ncbi:Hemolysin-type calcium-binding region (fragment) [Mesorhizobium plurifarium]|uniref:Hemolysin-type calcium-binding region n=1 Tax=Mesorhizobium plurifarium TaxID=69974 RepID=A0A090GAJ6_MESPL
MATGTAHYTAFFDAGGTQPYFTLAMKADGTYTFEVINPVPTVVVTDTTSLAASLGGNNNSLYLEQITVKNHLSPPHTDILFTGNSGWNGTSLGSATTVNSNSNGLGIGTGQTMDHNESITLKFLQGDGDNNSSTHSTTPVGMDHVTINFLQGSNGAQMTGSYAVDVITYDQSGTAHNLGSMNIVNGILDLSPSSLIYGVSIVNIGNTGLIVAGTTTSVTTSIENPSDVGLHFNVNIADGDGDQTSHGFDIIVDANDGHQATLTGDASYDPNILSGGPGDDILIAAPGNNTMTGGDGADTFVINADTWNKNGSIHDLITDYHYDNGNGDIVDLSKVLDDVFGGTPTLQQATDSIKATSDGTSIHIDVIQGSSSVEVATLTAYSGISDTIKIVYDDSHNATNVHVTP